MSETIISTVRTESPIQSVITPAARIVSEISRASQGPIGPQGPQGPPGVNEESFEKVSKNIRSYPCTYVYETGKLRTITYDLGGGQTITKTLNYTGNQLTSVVLTGDLPAGINTTKTFTYTGTALTSVTYGA